MKERKRICWFAAAVLLAGTLLQSCSIKEDRTPCPCYLQVSFVDGSLLTRPVTIALWETGERYRNVVNAAECDPYWEKPVVKAVYTLGAVTGMDEAALSSRTVTIPDGKQCDSLYAFHMEVDCTGEIAKVEAAMHKQFATVRVDLLKSADQMKEFSFYIKGSWFGFDILDYSPVKGPFSFKPETSGRTVDFRIPRQGDDSLQMEVTFQGEKVGVFPIGTYIARMGYNWNTEDLQDIFITIDIILGQVMLRVEGWEEGAWFSFIEQ